MFLLHEDTAVVDPLSPPFLASLKFKYVISGTVLVEILWTDLPELWS